MFACEKKEKTSQYKGVYWHKQSGRWYAQLQVKGKKKKYGGTFKDELDAAKRVDQLCEELKIPPQNPGIEEPPTQQSPVAENYFFCLIGLSEKCLTLVKTYFFKLNFHIQNMFSVEDDRQTLSKNSF